MPITYLDEEPASKSKIVFLDEEEPSASPEPSKPSFLLDQFGPNPKPFNMLSRMGFMGGPSAAVMEQPGAALPFAGQVAGNMAGKKVAGKPGEFVGGILGSILGEGSRQLLGHVLGVQDSSQALKQLANVGKSAAASETTGLAISGLLDQFFKAAPSMSNRLMNSVLKPGKDVLKKSPNLGEEAAKAGFAGTQKQILENAQRVIDDTEQELQGIIQNQPETIKVNLQGLEYRLKGLEHSVFDSADKASIKGVREDLMSFFKGKKEGGFPRTNITVSEANQLKRDIYKKASDKAYGTVDIPAKKDALKAAGNYLKTQIENAIPDHPIAVLNQRIALAGKVRNAIENVIALDQKKNVVGMNDLMAATLGALTGMSTRDPYGIASMGLLLPFLRRVAETAPAKSISAKVLANAGSKTAQEGSREFGKLLKPFMTNTLTDRS